MPGKVKTAPTSRPEREPQNNQVEQQRHDRIRTGDPVVKQHEDHDHDQAQHRSLHAVANGISAERRTDGALFQILNRSWQSAGTEDLRQFVRRLLRKAAFDHSVVFDFSVDDGRGINVMVENNGELAANVLLGELAKMPCGILGQHEIHLPKSRDCWFGEIPERLRV